VRNGSRTPRGGERKLLSSRESEERKAPPLGGDSSRKLGTSDGPSPVLIFPPQSVQYIEGASHRVVVGRVEWTFSLKVVLARSPDKGIITGQAEESRTADT